MAPLGALSQAWVSAQASLPLGWHVAGLVHVESPMAAEVQVGSYTAAIVHADPLPDGSRTINLYWEEAEREVVLISSAGLDETLAIARGLYC